MNPLTDREDAAINGVNAALGVICSFHPGSSASKLSEWQHGPPSSAAPSLPPWHSRPCATARMGGGINTMAGLCVAASPWLIGFTAVARATRTHIIIGVLVALLAAFELWRMHGSPPARPA